MGNKNVYYLIAYYIHPTGFFLKFHDLIIIWEFAFIIRQ